MAEVIRMPRMSDTMTEGVIVEWHKKVGDKVKPATCLPKWKPIRLPWSWKATRMAHYYI